MESKTKQGLTIGPATEKLLQSLRTLETSQNLYYLACVEVGGENFADDMLKQSGPQWDAVHDVISRDIISLLTDWANANPARNEI